MPEKATSHSILTASTPPLPCDRRRISATSIAFMAVCCSSCTNEISSYHLVLFRFLLASRMFHCKRRPMQKGLYLQYVLQETKTSFAAEHLLFCLLSSGEALGSFHGSCCSPGQHVFFPLPALFPLLAWSRNNIHICKHRFFLIGQITSNVNTESL